MKDSSGDEIKNDNVQVGFINTAVAMGTVNQATYTGLQRELVGYEKLRPPVYLEVLDSPGCLPPPECSIETEDVSGYTLPQIQSSRNIVDDLCDQDCIYEEMPDSPTEVESGYLSPMSLSSEHIKAPKSPVQSCLSLEYESMYPVIKFDGNHETIDISAFSPPPDSDDEYIMSRL